MRRLKMLIALGVLLAACSSQIEGLGQPGEATNTTSGASAPSVDEGEEVRDRSGIVDVEFVADDGRRVVRQASLSLHAADTRDLYSEIITLTEAMGGFVAHAEVSPTSGEDDQPSVAMTLRIPAEQMTAALRDIKGKADEVVSESQGAQDVTAQFVDLEARLHNSQALEVELRALLEEVRKQPDADPAKLLTVFEELASVRGEIEQLQGQIDYLADLTDLATVQVQIDQTPLAAPIVEEPWAPAEAAKDAARKLVGSLQVIADWAIGFVIYTLPVLVLGLSIPALIAWVVYRQWRKRRSTPERPAPVTS
jgi:hypothetical protein